MLSTRLFFWGLDEKWPQHCEVPCGKERVLTHQAHKENDLILREGGGLMLLCGDTSLCSSVLKSTTGSLIAFLSASD